MKSRPVTTSIAALRALFRVRTDNPELVQAQIKALSKQVPLLFFIALVNTLATAYTHYAIAPDILTVGFPILAMIGYLGRGWMWVKTGYRQVSHTDAVHLLRMMAIESPVASAIVLVWAFTSSNTATPTRRAMSSSRWV